MTKFIILSTPRTGSNIFTEILGIYLKRHHGYGPILYEYFNVYNKNYDYAINKKGNLRVIKINNKINDFSKARKDRFKILRDHLENKNKLYMIKLLTSQINTEIFDYFNRDYNFILIERKDTFQQILSWALAENTQIWLERTAKPYQHKIVLTKKWFDHMIEEVVKYKEFWKPRINNIRSIIYYEDIIKFDNKWESIKLAGFDTVEEGNFDLPQKHIYIDNDKLNHFENKQEILDWWNDATRSNFICRIRYGT